MGKRNKIRYQSKPKEKAPVTLSGRVFLQYWDEEALESPSQGDLLLYPYNEALNTTKQGQYREKGFTGYFKADVYKGKSWCPVLFGNIFPDREHYFSKTEQPFDTYTVCAEKLRTLKGTILHRTYREHYAFEEDSENEEGEE